MAAVAPEVLDVLERAEVAGNALTLTGQLDRNLYTKVAKTLSLVGGKWDRRAGAHLFDQDAADALESILATGTVVSRKTLLQAFFTPADLAARVVAAADVELGHKVLEPSAGEGAIALAARAAGADVYCLDIDAAHVDVLAGAGFPAVQDDFLTVAPIAAYDRVVMNPPFTRQQDVQHVTHALRFLKPGGKLAAIMSPTWRTRNTSVSEAFRELLAQSGGKVQALPEASFKASGTLVSTVLVTMVPA